MKIYKYPIDLKTHQIIRLPSPQRFLSFQLQQDQLCVWYEVNDNPSSDDFDEIDFMIVGTGDKAPEDSHYLGTVQQQEFVWHLYAKAVR